MFELSIMLQWGLFVLIALAFYGLATALWLWNNSLMEEIEAAFWDEDNSPYEPEPRPDLYRLDWAPSHGGDTRQS